MKGRVVAMAVCIMVVLAWASGAHGAGGNPQGEELLQSTHRSSAKTAAFGQQSLFECPCSYQYCDDTRWSLCSCNTDQCSCTCHNSAETKIPPGATIQKLSTDP